MSIHLGLALSGGGFRATLFHVGVIRFLREVGLLQDVTHIASVSGGSIIAAHLTLNWERYNGTDEEFDDAVSEIVRFVQIDVRNRIARRIPFQLPLRLLNRVLIGRPNRALTSNGLLERHYRDFLFGDRCFHQLPASPELHVLATNLSDGNLASFTRDGLYLQRRGDEEKLDFVPARLAPISMAVAASSAFPGFFPPVLFSASDVGVRAGEFSYLSFTDGGVYDNLGVRAFRWMRHLRRQRNAEFRVEDLDDAETVLNACRAAADDPSSPLGWIRSRFSPDLRDRLDGDDRRTQETRSLLCREISGLVRRHRFTEEPVFGDLRPTDDEAAEWFDKAKNNSVNDARHEWLNRHLLAAALEQVVGRPCLKLTPGDFDRILVSDCGQSFNVQGDARMGFLAQSVRASDIMWDRVWQLEKENFSKVGQYVFLPITDTIDGERDPDANPLVIQSAIQSIRTDLDRFSDLEIKALVEHGYTVARAICRESGTIPAEDIPDGPPWNPFKKSTETRESGADPSEGDRVTREARSLRRSAGRRIWSTVLDYRDWPTYVFIPLLILILIVLPWRAWTFYRDSQTLDTIVRAIEQGDPDIKKVLDIVADDPIDDWVPSEVAKAEAVTTATHDGLTFLTRSRIEDRRHYRPGAEATQPAVYLRERYTVRKSEDYSGDGRVVLTYPLPANVELRGGPSELKPVIRRTAETVSFLGAKRFLYEFEYDISDVPPGGSVALVAEGLIRHGQTSATEFGQDRSIFRASMPIEVVSVWLLFPSDRPYENYSLTLRSPDESKPPRMVETRYTIDHPYGSLIGWSLVNPEVGGVYECRWTVPE